MTYVNSSNRGCRPAPLFWIVHPDGAEADPVRCHPLDPGTSSGDFTIALVSALIAHLSVGDGPEAWSWSVGYLVLAKLS